jgi:excisionase family DNA binding protein
VTNNQTMDRKLLRVAEAAEILGISRASVYRLIDRKVLATVSFSVTGAPVMRITNASVMALLDDGA